MSLQKPNRATAAQLGLFHTQDYIEFLERAKPETVIEQEVATGMVKSTWIMARSFLLWLEEAS